MQTLTKNRRNFRKQVSYGNCEVDKLNKMETVLMEYYGYDYSQLHKVLIRERYKQVML